MSDASEAIAEQVRDAAATRTALSITGGDSKNFYGRLTQAESLSTTNHRGVVGYEPTELIITARAGTPLAEVEQVLADAGQALPFEPPHFGAGATLGGTIACGFSGPARPWTGAARDFVLGTRIVNGRGEVLRFGGEVMKNVAGYDVSRLMTGALGTLGVILDVSMKVLPTPVATRTLGFEVSADQGLDQLANMAAQPLPVSGACHDGTHLYVRLSGSEKGVASAAEALGGDAVDDADGFWQSVREHTAPFFAGSEALWRLSVAQATPQQPLADALGDRWLLDWGGAQRWLRTDADAATVHECARAHGGHATAFRAGERTGEVFQPLNPVVARLHARLKDAFDPHHIFNPGRMYADF